MICNSMLLKKFFRFTMTYTQKKYINIIRKFVCKYKICFTDQVAMNMTDCIAAVTFAMDEADRCKRMVDKQPDQFTTSIACASNNTNFKIFHWHLLLPGDRSSSGCRIFY